MRDDLYLKSRAAFNSYAALGGDALPADEFSALQVRLARVENRALGISDEAQTALGLMARVADVVEVYFGERSRMLDLMLRLSLETKRIAGLVQKSRAQADALKGLYDAEPYRAELAARVGGVVTFLMSLCNSNRLDFAEIVRETLRELTEVVEKEEKR